MASETILKINNLSKRYDHIIAVDHLNLEVKKGEIFGLLGHNGAGKSTTMRMMLSLVKPSEGDIHVFGTELNKKRESILANIGSIIEKPDFYPWLSGELNLKIFAGLSRKQISKETIQASLESVGLSKRAKDKVKTYSHGMKQRLGLAQAMVHDPDLIILDEPTTGLDPKGIIELRELILDLKNKHEKTVILSSHILSEVELVADSMAIIHNGKNIIEGSVSELLSHQNLMVNIQVSNFIKSKELLENQHYVIQHFNKDTNELSIEITKEKINHMIRILLDNGIDLQQLTSRRRLEDYFLKMTADKI